MIGLKTAAQVCALALATALVTPASAAEGFGKKIGQTGRWTLYAEINSMTDQKDCTALFDDRIGVQLTHDSLAISLRGRGGIRAYRIRLDEAPARPLQLATDREKGVSAIFISDDLFSEAVGSKRLRVAAFTILSSTVEEDIDLSGIAKVRQTFDSAGCRS